MKELKETYFSTFQILEEGGVEGSKKRPMRVRGLFQKADTINENKRLYPKKVLEKSIKEAQEKIKNKSFFGEVDHPRDGRATIKNTAALITKIEIMDDGGVFGEAEILDTDAGRNLKEILRAGGKIGISSRGNGSTKTEDIDGQSVEVVQEDYKLAGFDFVINPSVPEARVDTVIENKNKEDKMAVTIEELKKKYPDIFKEYDQVKEKEITEKVKKEFEKEIEQKVEERLEAEKESIINAVLESEEIQDLLETNDLVEEYADALGKIHEIVSPLVEESDIEEGNKDDKETEKLKNDIENLKRENEEKEETLNALKEEIEREKIKARILDITKNETYGELIAKRLEECETVEEVEERFEEEKKYIESITNKSVPKGKAKVNLPEDKTTDDYIEREVAIAKAI